MNNEYEYEILDLEDDYIKEITGKNTINIDINEYKNIIKNLINKTSKLENDNKKKDMDFLELNSKYFNVLESFSCYLAHGFFVSFPVFFKKRIGFIERLIEFIFSMF